MCLDRHTLSVVLAAHADSILFPFKHRTERQCALIL